MCVASLRILKDEAGTDVPASPCSYQGKDKSHHQWSSCHVFAAVIQQSRRHLPLQSGQIMRLHPEVDLLAIRKFCRSCL